MSLSSLATDEISRNEPQFLEKQAMPLVHEATTRIASTLGLIGPQMEILRDGIVPVATAQPIKPGPSSNVLDALTKFIPTESVTLYVAATSAMAAFRETFGISEATIYWFFVIFTPIIFLLIFCGKRREAELQLLPSFKKWPWFKLVASSVAFAFWALAIPTNPYLHGAAGGTIGAFCALFVSTFLTLLQPFFER